MVPWGLPEGDETDGVLTTKPGASLPRLVDIREKFGTVQAGQGSCRLQQHDMADHLTAICSHDFDWRDLASPFTDVEHERKRYVKTSFGEVHAALGVVGETAEELIPHRDHLVRLLTSAGHSPRNFDILAIAEHSSKRVTRKRIGRRFTPSHDGAGVQPPGESYPNPFFAIEVPWEVSGENTAQFLIVGFRLEGSLVLPLPRLEIRAFPLDCTVAKNPGRS